MDNHLSLLLFGEGMLSGIMLTMMLGPVTMVILRNGLEINRRAGLWAAFGTWMSDFIFITITFWMTNRITHWTNDPMTRLVLYLTGGFGLVTMGMLLTKVKRRSYLESFHARTIGYAKAFLSGFIVNSLSPFTLFFWLGVAVFLHLQKQPPLYYYVGLMFTLGIGDITKAWLAPKLVQWLKEKYIYWIQVIAGILIALTGAYIVYLGIAG